MRTLLRAFTIVFVFILFSAWLNAASEKTYMKQGTKLYASKNYNAAYSAFEKVVKINPRNYQAYIYMGYCRLAVKDKKGAIKNLEKSLAIKDNAAIRKYVYLLKYGKRAASQAADAYYYTGGENRAAALGGPTLIMRDASAPFDLYGGADNTAALAFRQKKDFVSAGLTFDPAWGTITGNITIPSLFPGIPSVTYNYSAKTDENIFLIGGDLRNNENIATYWIDNDDVISAKMMYGNIGISASESASAGYTGGAPQIGGSLGAALPGNEFQGDIDYARKITNMISAGITLGYEGRGSILRAKKCQTM